MSVLRLITEDKKLILLDDITLTSGSVNIDDISIKIDDSWLINDASYYLSFTNVDDSLDKIKTELIQNDNQLTAKTSPFITNKSGEWYMGLYANVNDVIVKTSTVVVTKVEKGATTDAIDPFEPIRKEAYEEGYNDGYEEGHVFEKQIVDFYESLTPSYVINNNDIFGKGNENHLLDFPYINTENVSFLANYDSSIIGKYTRTVGFDVSLSEGVRETYFKNCISLEKCILTGIKKAIEENRKLSVWGLINCWKGCTNLEEVYTDGLGALLDTYNRNYLTNTFDGCQNLRIIGGFNKETREIDSINFGEIDFHRCTNTNEMFKDCYKLEEVRFTPLQLTVNLNMSQSNRLSQKSILSLINALSLAKTATIILHPDIKDLIANEWFCKFDASTGLYSITNPETDPTAMSFSVAVAAKGWILS